MLGDALRVGAGGVDDLDAAGGGGVDVDLIVADAVPAHDLELVAAIEERRVDDAAGADDERVGTDDLALQGRRIEGAGHPQLGRIPQDLQAGFVHGGQRKEDRAVFHRAARSSGFVKLDSIEGLYSELPSIRPRSSPFAGLPAGRSTLMPHRRRLDPLWAIILLAVVLRGAVMAGSRARLTIPTTTCRWRGRWPPATASCSREGPRPIGLRFTR